MKLLINDLVVEGSLKEIVKAIDEYAPVTLYISLAFSSDSEESIIRTITKPDWKEEKEEFLNKIIQQILQREEYSTFLTKIFS